MATNKTKDRFKEIEDLAHAAGLRHYDVQFFEVPSSVIYEVASYGLPTRYSHWSFGRTYQYQKTRGEMGHSKIYELILNNNPSYAFLDTGNTETINLMICAHCLAHSDVFANNIMFREAQEDNMVQVAKRHAEAIDQYRKDYGDDEVDGWLDIALSMERHIDVYKKLRRSRYEKRHIEFHEREIGEWEDLVPNDEPLVKKTVEGAHLPPKPEKDLLWFLAEYANMEDWQKRIFEIVRRESYYFYPQYRTKCLNEGWACVSKDARISTEKGLISAEKYVTEAFDDVKVFDSNDFVSRSSIYITNKKRGKIIITNKGIILRCADDHKIQLSSKEFLKAKDLTLGKKLKLSPGKDVWSTNIVSINCSYKPHKNSKKAVKTIGQVEVDERLGSFLGFWIGEGCQSKLRSIYIRNNDKQILEYYGEYIKTKFGLNYSIVKTKEPHLRYNLEIYSRALVVLLDDITGCVDCTSRFKRVPDVIFESPKSVVCSFIGSLYDAEGCVYSDNRQNAIVFSSSSLHMINDVAVLLHQMDIHGSFNKCKKEGYEDTYQLRIGKRLYIKNFHKQIYLRNTAKQSKLDLMVSAFDKVLGKKESDFIATVVDIKSCEDEFYDFTVPSSHMYVANGLIHHNSYWHAELMLQYSLGDDNEYGVKGIKYPLTPEEHLDFLSSHEKVVQAGVKIQLKAEQPEVDQYGRPTGRTIKDWHPRIIENPRLFYYATRINPYYVGFRMFRDIKERWDKYFEEGYYEDEWGKKVPVVINGNQKIREVMIAEDDVSFFRNYLTEELADKLHLFAFGSPKEYHDNYKIQEEIKKRMNDNKDRQLGSFPIDEQLKTNKTIKVRTKDLNDIIRTFARAHNNYGVPCLVVRRVDSDGTLRLEHVEDDLTNVDIGYGEHTLKYIFRVWGRPVELIRKNVDHTHVMKYDASGFSLDHATSDYPESIEEKDSASSW